MKGRNLLTGKGYRAFVKRPPEIEGECGCGYCIGINNGNIEQVAKILIDNGVKVKRIITVDENEGGRY